jgi:hypothetical protein
LNGEIIDMPEPAHMLLVAEALKDQNPAVAINRVAEHLRNKGMPQQALYELLDHYRALHEHDDDETTYNAILDVLDRVSGFCAPFVKLYEPS